MRRVPEGLRAPALLRAPGGRARAPPRLLRRLLRAWRKLRPRALAHCLSCFFRILRSATELARAKRTHQ